MDSALSQSFISLAFDKLGGLIETYINEQFQYQRTDVRKNLKQLKTSLTKIKAYVAVAEKMKNKETNLVEWLSELRNAIYDAEYVMDEFEYQRLKDIVESWPENKVKVATPPPTNKKVCLPLKMSSCCPKLKASSSTFAKRLFFADEQLNELLEIVKRFDELVISMGNFADLLKLHHEVDQHPLVQPAVGTASRETTSVRDEPGKLSGRDEEESKLLELLLQSSNGSGARKFRVVSVVGVGGVGKTALAQSVFNHQRVKDYFQVRAWVSVSTDFDIKSLMRGCVEAAGIEKLTDFHSLTTLESIQAVLIEGLQSKRFLIVLDDVWEDMQHKWVDVCKPFYRGMDGSKILVTSRSRDVARTMGVEEKMQIDLKPLQFEYFWNFFQKCAFRDKNPENYPRLKKIGEGIALKLGGLPLAAKTVGGVLCTNLNVDHWRTVLNNKVWKEGEGVISALKLSYDHLPVHLKKSFAYCCLFPKDCKYQGRTLIDIWVGLDCLAPTDRNKRLVDIRRSYVEELVSRCFLDIFQQHPNEDDCTYVIHDLLHDLAEKVVGDEVHRVEDDKSLCDEVPCSVRHLYIKSTCSGLDLVLKKIVAKKIRSLVFIEVKEEEEEWEMSEETIQKLRGLHLLFLIYSSSKRMWQNLGDLVHLRCTNFHSRGPGTHIFPSSIWKLYQLEIFRWLSYDKIKNFHHLHKLISLKHVDFSVPYFYHEAVTSYLGRLKSLEEVPGNILIINGEAGNDIGQLGELNKIGGELTLIVCVKLSEAEARKANLIHKQYLTELSIVDKYSEEREDEGIEAEAIEALQPHQNLEELTIAHCKSITILPTWLAALSNLTQLKLYKLSKLQGFPPNLGYDLLFLEGLWLRYLPLVKQININFSSLKTLAIEYCDNLESLTKHSNANKDDDELKVFPPSLKTLILKGCPKLKLPASTILQLHQPSSIRNITIEDCKEIKRSFFAFYQ